MKEIALTQGFVTFVDDEDYALLSRRRWKAMKVEGRVYAVRTDNRGQTTLLMHRVILGLKDSRIKCDHINGNGLDNQRHNLRPATNAQNSANQRKRADTSSRFKGVSLHLGRKWSAYICPNGKKKHLGQFEVEEDAAKAYDAAAIIAYGPFAKLNFP